MAKQGLSSIGIKVTIGTTELNFVTDIGDIGGAPSELDATCLKDKMKHTVPGVKDVKSWECKYLYDNSEADSDYRVIRALEEAEKIVPVEVGFPDGTKFATKGYVNTMVNGVKVDELIGATATVSLQEDWKVTNPTNTP